MNRYDLSDDTKDMLYVAGGIGLIALGIGLLMLHPDVRRALANPEMRGALMEKLNGILPSGLNLQDPLKAGIAGLLPMGIAGLLPDIERYIKARSM